MTPHFGLATLRNEGAGESCPVRPTWPLQGLGQGPNLYTYEGCMQPVRFVHAADLHLDAVFPGLARDVSAELGQRLHESTFVALRRLVDLCRAEQPDFLVLAGDTWNQEDLSLRAQTVLRDACEELGRLGVRVFLAHGNHDPLSSRLKALEWPKNVTVFGPVVESVPVQKAGHEEEVIAVVHGVSHVGPKETRNLASWFRRTEENCPHIGVLHTTLNVGGTGEAPYAPCSPEDLTATGLDYWALGHIHEHRQMMSRPTVIYAGSAQGLNINEQGAHGCVLVSMEEDGGGDWKIATRFCPLAPVGWKILDVNVEEVLPDCAHGAAHGATGADDGHDAAMGRLLRVLRDKLEDLVTVSDAQDSDEIWAGCESMVVRVRLCGRTALDAELRSMKGREELCELLREGQSNTGISLYIKDIEVDTRPLLDRQAALGRGDLLSEVLLRADGWRGDKALLESNAREALGDLFGRGRSGRVLSEPAGEVLERLLDEAERVCADMLERPER